MPRWLEGLKVGDEVVVRGHREMLSVVTRLTPSMVVVGATRFRKSDGVEVGGSTWTSTYLFEATPEEVRRIRGKEEIRRLIANIEATKWRTLSVETLRAVVAAITGEQS